MRWRFSQAKFRAVYGTQTYSNNNCWLRRKLMEGEVPLQQAARLMLLIRVYPSGPRVIRA